MLSFWIDGVFLKLSVSDGGDIIDAAFINDFSSFAPGFGDEFANTFLDDWENTFLDEAACFET